MRRLDSNQRPSGYEPDELPLLHAAMGMAHGSSLPAVQPPVPSTLPRFTTRFGMERGGSTVPHARHWLRGQCILSVKGTTHRIITPCAHVFPQGSPRPCARVACTCRHASSSRRLPSHLLGGLPGKSRECIHLAAHFPLRCFQRFLLPDIATQPAGRPTTAPPAVRPRRSSRTERSSAQCTKRP